MDFFPLCGSRKYPYSLHRREWNFLGGGGGVLEDQKLKEMYEAFLEFPEGGVCGGGGGEGVLDIHTYVLERMTYEKIPSVGEVWIFSGATHCPKIVINTSSKS